MSDPSVENKYHQFLEIIGIDVSTFESPLREQIPEYSVNQNGERELNFIEFDETIIFDEVKCPICLDYVDKTSTVMACLHRFCSECLHRCLRMDIGPNRSSHECPACRVKIASKRASKPDPLFDNISDLFNPTPKGSDSPRTTMSKKTQRLEANIDTAFFRQLHSDNVKKFREKQRKLVKVKSSYEVNAPLNTSQSLQNQRREVIGRDLNVLNNITFAIFPWPENMHVDMIPTHSFAVFARPYLSVPSTLTISDVKKYVVYISPKVVCNTTFRTDLSFEYSYKHIDIAIIADKIRILSDEMTLIQVCSMVWSKQGPFIFHARINPNYCQQYENEKLQHRIHVKVESNEVNEGFSNDPNHHHPSNTRDSI